MKNKEWFVSESLMFNEEGKRINGSHRLRAVILANMEVEFLVVWGIKDAAKHTLDRHRRRSMSTVMKLLGEEFSQPYISIFSNIYYCLPSRRAIASSFTDGEMAKGLRSLKDSFPLCFKYKNINSASLRAVVARAFFCNSVMNKNLLSDFLAIVNGFNYQDNPEMFSQTKLSPSAPLKLRDLFLAKQWSKQGGGLMETQCFYVQKALFNYLKNKVTKKMTMSQGNLFPVDFIDNQLFKQEEIDFF